jgi:hypothetical protein
MVPCSSTRIIAYLRVSNSPGPRCKVWLRLSDSSEHVYAEVAEGTGTYNRPCLAKFQQLERYYETRATAYDDYEGIKWHEAGSIDLSDDDLERLQAVFPNAKCDQLSLTRLAWIGVA